MRMDTRGPDAGTLLGRALRLSSAAAACPVRIVAIAGEPWSSATFTGLRHRIVVAGLHGAAFDAWLSTLDEAAFALKGHVVVDLVVEDVVTCGEERRATLAALTLADA